ncbi:MAG: dTDP-4-dehydrorhamnose reductase [Pseudomonadota bacterium]
MNVLVLGGGGQIGRALADRKWPTGIVPIWAGRAQADLAEKGALFAFLERSAPDLIINCAAYTSVDRAEDDRQLAFTVNGEAPGWIAAYCRSAGIPLIHFSTDYVFDGTLDRAYREDDPVSPLGAYGASKAAGEAAIAAAAADCWILRTAWVFGPHGGNFVRTMLRAARSNAHLTVVDDQIGTPAPTPAIAAAVLKLVERWTVGQYAPFGTYHLAGDEPVTWFGLAEAVFDAARTTAPGWPQPDLVPITTDQWPTKARRPANSRLDGGKANAMLGLAPLAWRAALPGIVSDIIEDLRKSTP